MDWFCRECKFSGQWEDLEPNDEYEVFCTSCGGWLEYELDFVEEVIVPRVKKRDEAYRQAIQIHNDLHRDKVISNESREWLRLMADLEHNNNEEN